MDDVVASDNTESESEEEGLIFGVFSPKSSWILLAAIASVAVYVACLELYQL